MQAWRERDLDPVYPIVWFDAIHYKIRENGRYVGKAIYNLLGLNIEGKKGCKHGQSSQQFRSTQFVEKATK